ncbi:MAG: TVP38/TMEM64 family protein [Pseudanabaena sp. M34BS1SP1A06MG]|uniref:TVP38/TMEM64 family protein n=1 Tax=Pseudanabaena mucicola TaxID=71190 RepID=UPI002576BAF5|nr:VTT domain-containing protein [Pseudanabaena mucicola]MCA6583878.1 TVP38/TMEM64 family protein [Pseudanabaena sp. M34BS1SP1A06MG]
MNKKSLITIFFILITIFSIWITFTHIDWLNQIQAIAQESGIWGYAFFVITYAIATLLILPVTAFNIAGGALYGGIEGLLITSLGALLSALLGFILARSLNFSADDERWAKISQKLEDGGIAYSFAARLLPIIPYGVVSFAAGLSPIKRRDYLIGTLLGTPLGIAPFVFLGSTGVQMGTSDDVLPLLASSMGLAVLIAVGTWYKSSQN